jgi:predicted DNA-binding protein
MDVQFTPDVEKKLNDLAEQSGRPSAAALVKDVVEGYFAEVLGVRQMLDSRYDDLKSGRVQPIGGEEAFKGLMARTEAQRHRRA